MEHYYYTTSKQVYCLASFFSKIKPIKIIGLILIIFQFLLAFEVSASPFAQVASITHSCGEDGGTIEMEVLGEENDFTWYWTHGPTDLILENLDPGTYTFIIKNIHTGCVEEYDVEILGKDLCEAEFDQIELNYCWVELLITFEHNGQIIPENELIIDWADSSSAGLSRNVLRGCLGALDQYCVTVSLADTTGICCEGMEPCCEFDFCFEVEGRRSCCTPHLEEIIVNEFNRAADGTDQFVELLVLGTSVCGDSIDIRGFHIDDNDGYLIPGGEFVNFYNKQQIGIDNGYLIFSHHPNWEAVPNGSLIVIYPPGNEHPSVPADDPTDSNQDGVYVLPVDDSEYFVAREGLWNNNLKRLEAGGSLALPDGALIDISSNADGIQVRWDEGSYMHGISLGESLYSVDNTFSLWLTNASSSSSNCRFTGQDYLVKTDFSFDLAEANLQSPGQANSTDNANLISSLNDCGSRSEGLDDPTMPLGQVSNKASKNTLVVFPNPFDNELLFQFKTQLEGETKVSFFAVSGQELLKANWTSEKGDNSYSLQLERRLPPGVLICQFTFPSGEVVNKKLVRMDSY